MLWERLDSFRGVYMELIDLQKILDIELAKPLEDIDTNTVAELVDLLGENDIPAEVAEKIANERA